MDTQSLIAAALIIAAMAVQIGIIAKRLHRRYYGAMIALVLAALAVLGGGA